MLAEDDDMEAGSSADTPAKGAGKVRLMRLDDLDGRTKARKAADRMLGDLLGDLGGSDQVSTGKRALAEHAAVLNAMAIDQGARYLSGEPVDVTAYSTVINSLRRLLTDIGLQRVPRDVTDLHTYIRREESAA